MTREDALAHLVSNASIAQPDKPIRVLGIDLGTTNSSIAEFSWSLNEPNARARCLEVDQQTAQGMYTHVMVPSIVAIHEGQEWVGEGAKRIRARTGELGLRQNKNLFFDCKNEIGLGRTYPQAPETYRSPAEIGAHILKFLVDAAGNEGLEDPDRTVVTVPASFQAAQRRETLRAAELAGIMLESGDLLDEPLAAFLDIFVARGPAEFQVGRDGKILLVFDFGGGTCDIAVFKLQFKEGEQSMTVAPLSVSRYHRLGGGDIDDAIVFEVLLPQLLEQNGLLPLDLSFDEKRNFARPALLGIAESLKIGLCTEIQRLGELGNLEGYAMQDIEKVLPGQQRIEIGERSLIVSSPSLNGAQFEELLAPFIDQELLYFHETEYRSSCSVFAPISDALERAHLLPEEVDYCLLVGGSSLIPQVRDAVSEYLDTAQILTYSELDEVQTAVARGAAYHALLLEVSDHGLFQPAAHDDIAIRTSAGLVTLIAQGDTLPATVRTSLAVPQTTLLEPCELRVEILGSGVEARPIFSSIWPIPGPVSKGDELSLVCTLDANQVLSFELRLVADGNRAPFEASIENPLTHVVNPLRERLRIDAREEALRRGEIPRTQIGDELHDLAVAYGELGQREKSLEYLNRALRAKGAPDAEILNRMGIISGELRDYERQEKFYREAARIGSSSGPLFNLACSQREQRRLQEAAATIEEALTLQRAPEYLVMAGWIAHEEGRHEAAKRLMAEAKEKFPAIPSMSDFSLGWARRLGTLLPDPEFEEQCQEERRRRTKSGTVEMSSEALLPDLKGDLVKVRQ